MAGHQCFEILDFGSHLLLSFGFAPHNGQQLGSLLQAFHLMVDGGNGRLAVLELALRVQQVIDGRHKEVVPDAARQVARERRQKSQSPLGIACHQHAQHLACRHFFGPIVARRHILLHPFDRHPRQRVRLVAERAGESLGQLHGPGIFSQQMEFVNHHRKITAFIFKITLLVLNLHFNHHHLN